MSRFELTLLGGEKLFVEALDHSSLEDVRSDLQSNQFCIFREFRSGLGGREVVVASSGVLLLRALTEGSQGSSFIAKR